jgi:spectinomycin phosphotransferase
VSEEDGVLREDPGLDRGAIAASIAAHYGIHVTAVEYLPIGFDMRAAVYRVVAEDGVDLFLKIRFGPAFEPGLQVPRALIDLGIPNILAPLRTISGDLWAPLEDSGGHSMVLYPFIHGESAKVAGLTAGQFRTFGATLRAVHASGLERRFRDQLRVEDFALPSAAKVRGILAILDDGATFESPAATRLAAFWREHADPIRSTLDRAEELGRTLQGKSFDLVLCHSDIHLTNILVGADGRIWLIDWDLPIIAPRERDLLFIVGSTIGRPVLPDDEDHFFAGYGPTEIDPIALAYYRYERRIEDLGEIAESVFLDPDISEAVRAAETEMVVGFFDPGGSLDRIEVIPRHTWPTA